MSHEISIRKNGFAEMAYVGEKPWHSLGQAVTKGASLETWEKEAGLDWSAKRSPVKFTDEAGKTIDYDSQHVIYRSDTMAPLGVASSKYEIVQPKQMLGSFRKLVEGAGWHIHTAGVLRGGARLWVMASHDSLIARVGKNDTIKANLLAATSLDGSLRTLYKAINERVVCANTLSMAMSEDGEEISFSHRSKIDEDELAGSLDGVQHSLEQFAECANELAERMVGVEEATEVLRGIFGKPTVKALNEKAPDYEFQRLMAQVSKVDGKLREQRSVTRCLALFDGEGIGADLVTAKGTAWGLLNACTQHVDHELGRTADGRMDSAWLGRGDVIKSSMLAALTA